MRYVLNSHVFAYTCIMYIEPEECLKTDETNVQNS